MVKTSTVEISTVEISTEKFMAKERQVIVLQISKHISKQIPQISSCILKLTPRPILKCIHKYMCKLASKPMPKHMSRPIHKHMPEHMHEHTLEYDLDIDMLPAEGIIIFNDGGELISYIGEKRLLILSVNEVAEVIVVGDVGCGYLYARMKNEKEILLCRFTASIMKAAGEFSKIVNYYIKTKEYIAPGENKRSICSKCGRPFAEGMAICLFCYNKIGVLKRSIKLMAPFARKIIPSEIFMTLSSIMYLLIPLLSRILIDDYLRPMTGTFRNILFLSGAMFFARAIGEGIYILSSRVFNKASILYANHLRNLTFGKIQKLSMSSLAKRTPGDLIRRIMEDTNAIKDFISDGGRWAIEQLIMLIVVLTILAFTNLGLTLLIFIPVPIVSIALSRFTRIIHTRYEKQWQKNSKCQSILHDIIKGIRTVKAFGREEAETQKFANATQELAQISSDNEALWAYLFPLLMFFTGIGEILILYFGGQQILNDSLSLGVLVQFTMYIAYVYAPLRWLVSFPRWMAEAMTSMVKIFEILDEDPDIKSVDNPNNVSLSGNISFKDVSFGYKSYEPVLKDINLEIKSGEMIGIVGRSGAGKSTMINLIMRLYDPGRGKICINNTDIKEISPDYLHENIGVVFQDIFLFAGTIYDNIAYAKPNATIAEVIAAAKAANAHDFIIQTADGYNTIIGEGGYSISGGERQKLAIARAIIKNPSILILDEATSSLDMETESTIQDSLDRIVKGRTTIAIAHRLSTLKNSNRLVVLDGGKIAEIGTHMELLRKKGIYYSLVMAQRNVSRASQE